MNDSEQKISHFKKLYQEIVMGFSVSTYMEKPIFIKHFSEINNGRQAGESSVFFNTAKKIGLLGREDKLELLLKEGYRLKEDEIEIEKLKKEISDQESILKNLIIKRQIEEVKQKKAKTELKLSEMLNEKYEALGFCVEDFVSQKMNELVIFNSFFKDEQLSQQLFSREEFDNLSQNDISSLIKILNDFYAEFSHNQIKRICACSFFINLFSLGSEGVSSFFGTHVTNLTILQVNLFSQGRYFKSMMESRKENVSPSSDIMADPDKMIEWYDSLFTASSLDYSNKTGGTTYVGASEEEVQSMVGGGAISLAEVAKKKGGSLTMRDFLEMHGV